MDTTQTTDTKPKGDFSEAIAASANAEIEKKQASKPPRTYTDKLPCKLTTEELAECGSQIAEAHAEIAKLEAEAKGARDGFKAQIALRKQRIASLAQVLSSKTESRDVELVEEFIFATNTVRVTRADTGEKWSERAMTKNERQEELPLDAKGEKADAKPKSKSKAKDQPPAPAKGDITEPQKVLDGEAGPAAKNAPEAGHGAPSDNATPTTA